MWARGIGFGMIMIAASSTAHAQTAAPAPTTFAAVDPSGRIVPARTPASQVDVIGRPAASAPPCGAVTALPADVARALVVRVARQENFYPDFVLSVAKIESRYSSTALSDKGAYGLMQLMPDTARRFNVDLCDPEANVRGGVQFLRALHERYRNPFFILSAYNAGEEAVRRSRGVPPFPETIRFVADVMNDFYTWPNPGEVTAAARRIASAGADIAEPDAAPATPSTHTDPHAAAPWSAGFVMHVD